MTNYKEYAVGMNASEEVISWIDTTLTNYLKKNNPRVVEVEHVIDYLVSSQGPKKLRRMSYPQAKEKAKAWTEAQQKKGKHIKESNKDIEVIHKFQSGYKIVKLLSTDAYKREGFLMRHCLGGYGLNKNIEIYSYRDSKNDPHATFEIQKNHGTISQIKGKGNGPIHPKYINDILVFLEIIGQKPRQSEMTNLGYYYIDKEHKDFVLSLDGSNTNTVTLYNDLYAY